MTKQRPGKRRRKLISIYTGNRIRIGRIERGWSQEKLGQMFGYSGSTINKFESGEREMKLSLFLSFCTALDVDLDDIIAVLSGYSDQAGIPPEIAGREALIACITELLEAEMPDVNAREIFIRQLDNIADENLRDIYKDMLKRPDIESDAS